MPSSTPRTDALQHPPHRRGPATRLITSAALALVAGAVFVSAGPATSAVADDLPSWATEPAPIADAADMPTYDSSYDGADPDVYCASHGLVRLQQQPLGGGIDGVIQLMYSRVCHAAWTRVRIDSAPPSAVVSVWPTLGREGVTGTDNEPDTSGSWVSWSPMLHADPGQCVTGDAELGFADGSGLSAPTLEDCS